MKIEDIMMRNQQLILENEALRQQIEDLKNGFEGSCMACEPVGEMNKKLRNELTERIHMCDMRSEKIIELTAELDDARREICQLKGTVRWNHYFPHFDPKGYAKNRGWDCHKDYK